MRRTLLFAYVWAVLLAMPFAAVNGDEKKATEVDGKWKLTKYIENGKPNEEIVKQNYLIVRKDGVQEITKDGKPFSKHTFEVDPAKSPKHIDIIDDRGSRLRGVYEIKGDEMRLATPADPDKQKTDRPSELKEEGNIIAVYERVKDK